MSRRYSVKLYKSISFFSYVDKQMRLSYIHQSRRINRVYKIPLSKGLEVLAQNFVSQVDYSEVNSFRLTRGECPAWECSFRRRQINKSSGVCFHRECMLLQRPGGDAERFSSTTRTLWKHFYTYRSFFWQHTEKKRCDPVNRRICWKKCSSQHSNIVHHE